MVFGLDSVEISYISTGNTIEKGVVIHASKKYAFSHFMSYSDPIHFYLSSEVDEGIKYPLFPFSYTTLLSIVLDSDNEDKYQHDLDIEITPQ